MDENKKKKHLEILKNKNEDFVKRIQSAGLLDLDYWEDRDNPPNLPRQSFELLLANIPSQYHLRFDIRKSAAGKNGSTGESSVFYLSFLKIVGRDSVQYLIKGYFFDDGNLKGVCVQTCRETGRAKRGKFRLKLSR